VIKIFLVCKSDVFFRTIEPILNESGIFIAGTSKSSTEALSMFEKSDADVILLDANWSPHGMEGLNILAGFLNHNRLLKVIFVTTFYDDRLAAKAKGTGAMGYLYRNVTHAKVIRDCIISVYEGKSYFTDK
jgi:DNA-binding NarL/FixJ family response regulator